MPRYPFYPELYKAHVAPPAARDADWPPHQTFLVTLAVVLGVGFYVVLLAVTLMR